MNVIFFLFIYVLIWCLFGSQSHTNLDFWHLIGSNSKIHFVKDRPGHDIRYALNSKKIKKKLKWSSKININDGLEKTFSWYVQNIKYFKDLKKKDIENRLGKDD